MAHEDWTGRVIDGRYAVESVIGAGGMGLVLRARHAFTGATVALKVVKPELELDNEFQQRFLVEARASNAIGHPAIVNVTDAGRAPDGLLYLAMELLVGRPLRIPAVRGELGAADIRRILLELLDVLGAAHAKGFVHRDLKPENVFLAGPNNQLKLLDFGIVKVLDAQLARVRTATGATLGTPAYMAPEQFADPRGVDARADLWAVGVMAYEMLAGSLPFRAETTHAMLLAIASANPDPIRAFLPQAPPVLEQFFARALSRDRAGRFASAAEMAQAVAALPFSTAIVPRPVPPMPGRAQLAQADTPVAHSIAHAATPIPYPNGGPISGSAPAVAASSLAAPVAPPSNDRRKWLVGLGLASLVSIALIVIAVVATRPSSPPPRPSTPTPTQPPSAPLVNATPEPAAHEPPPAPTLPVVPPSVHAGTKPNTARVERSTPRDAGVTALDAGDIASTPPAHAASAVDLQTICVDGCKAAAKCGTIPSNCVAQCVEKSAFRDCVKLPLASCNEVTACGMRLLCGASVLNGTDSCGTALSCQMARCAPGNVPCGCACAATMSPNHANALIAVDSCWIACGFNQTCMNTRCTRLYNACVQGQ